MKDENGNEIIAGAGIADSNQEPEDIQDSNVDYRALFEAEKTGREADNVKWQTKSSKLTQEQMRRKDQTKQDKELISQLQVQVSEFGEQDKDKDKQENARITSMQEKHTGEINEFIAKIAAKDEQLYDLKVKRKLLSVATNQGAVNPEQVMKLLQHDGRITLNDDGDVIILKPDGEQKFNGADAATIEDYVKEYLLLPGNENLRKKTIQAGSGSTPQPASKSGHVVLAPADQAKKDKLAAVFAHEGLTPQKTKINYNGG